jgi:predicted GNAT family acetyltransferase
VIRVHATDDLEEYAAAVGTFLEAEPCARNVLLTVIDNVRANPTAFTAPPGFWWITDFETVVGATSWTPPHGLLVSSMPPAAAPGLAAAALERASALGVRPSGVNGPAASARGVAAAWSAASGDAITRDRTILLNQLVALTEVAVPRGASRRAEAGDVRLVASWLDIFSVEIGHIAPVNSLALTDRMVHAGLFDLWVADGRPVCMVGHRVAAAVARVGPVYTPPEHRNRGYGRRLTYEVTAAAMARPDVHHAMLFTDADNPVSNSIYRQAGYEPRDEHVEIEFAKQNALPAH